MAPRGWCNLPAIVLVFLCTLLLIRGASESAKVNTVMVLVKLSVLILFVIIGLTAFKADRFDNFWAAGSAGITAAAGTIFFSFIGLDAVSTAGEEVRNPQKALPRAIMGALFIVVSIYVLVAIAGVGSQPLEEFSSDEQQNAGLSVIMENITGSAVPGTILAAGAVISIFSVTLVTLYGQTRILFAMGRDRMLPDKFAEVDSRTLTPRFNTIVVGVVVSLIAGFVPSDYLWDTVSIGTLVAFSVVAIGVMVLRRTMPDLHRPFRVPLFPIVADPHGRGVHLRAVGPGGDHLGDLRGLADDRALLLLPRRPASVPVERRDRRGRVPMTLLVGFPSGHEDRSGLELAATFARSSGQDLALVTVVPSAWPTPVAGHTDREFEAWSQARGREAVAAAEAILADHCPDLRAEATWVEGRSVPSALAEVAERTGASMIVVGAGHDGGYGRVVLGSTAHRLLHSSPVPVAVSTRGYRASDARTGGPRDLRLPGRRGLPSYPRAHRRHLP